MKSEIKTGFSRYKTIRRLVHPREFVRSTRSTEACWTTLRPVGFDRLIPAMMGNQRNSEKEKWFGGLV